MNHDDSFELGLTVSGSAKPEAGKTVFLSVLVSLSKVLVKVVISFAVGIYL